MASAVNTPNSYLSAVLLSHLFFLVKDSQSPPENGSVEKDEASIVNTSRGALALKRERSLYLLSDLNVRL